MSAPAFIKLNIVRSSTCLILLVIFNSMITASAAQSNNFNDNNNTNAIIEAIEALSTDTKYLKAKVTGKSFELNADVPVTNDLMAKGLAVKNQLKENEAMLFIFEDPAKYSFWMKDMKFPIDIIWLDGNGKAVHIEHSLQPCVSASICPNYTPNIDSQYVLETVTGFTQRHNISVGNNIELELVR